MCFSILLIPQRIEWSITFCMFVRIMISKQVIVVVFLFVSGLFSYLYALDPEKTIHQYGQNVWYRQNGLPANAVNIGFQGRDGYLWLGTSAGLFRFDGVNFKSVRTNPFNNDAVETIAALCVTSDSSLWVGTTYSGLLRIKNEKMILYDPSVDPKINIQSTQIRVLLESRLGNLWIGTSFGLYRYVHGKFSAVPIQPSFITALTEDAQGRIWIGTHNGIKIYDDNTATQIGSLTVANGLPQNMIISLYCDSRSNVWIGTVNGLACWNQTIVKVYSTNDGLSENHVTTICEDRDHNIWIGTYRGINRLANGKWSSMTEDDGLTNNHVLSMIEDYEGSLWVCTLEGLNRFKDVNITTFTTKEGLANDFITGIAETPDGSLHFLSDIGGSVTRLAKNKAPVVTHSIVGPAFVSRDGNLWVSQTGLILKIKDSQVVRYDTSKGIPVRWISAITEDEKSLIVYVDQVGLRRFKNGKLEPYRLRDGSPYSSTEFVACFYNQPNGSLWIGTTNGLTKIQDGVSTTFRQTDGLAGNWINSIFDDRTGNLWLSSPREGITNYKNGKFTPITFKDGLFTNEIYCILCDDYGNLWLSSPRGIGCIKKEVIADFLEGRSKTIQTQVYLTADGMKTDECFGGWQPVGLKTSDGHLWFATKKGAAMINPSKFKRNTIPPPVLIERVIVDQQTVALDQPIHFSPDKEKFEFQYTALSFLVPERVLFKYQLEGYDHDWVDAGTRRIAFYTNLPPGNYNFKVKACNNDGVWNETTTHVAFALEPHFYQTFWFFMIVVVGTIGTGFGLYRIRVWQLLKRERELKIKVDEALTKIKILGGLIPICASCKKIRDDKGYWDQLEGYIQTHSEARFSHGICPDCAKRLYPELFPAKKVS